MNKFSELIVLSPDEIAQAREWIADCQWPDLEPEEIKNLTAGEIARAVQRHFDGGVESFKASCLPPLNIAVLTMA
jgi:hypothetical protein